MLTNILLFFIMILLAHIEDTLSSLYREVKNNNKRI